MYKLQQTPPSHTGLVSEIVGRWGESSPDLCLVSSDGHSFFTHRFWFFIHSKFMASFLQEQSIGQIVTVFVPVTSNIIINILKIISHGDTKNHTKFNPMDIMEGAKLLGIVMDDLQVVFRDKKHLQNSEVVKIPEPEFEDNELEHGTL